LSDAARDENLFMRNAENEDKEEVIAHLGRIWGRKIAEEKNRIWNWLFLENPLSNGCLPPIYILTSNKKKVHGTILSTPVELLLFGSKTALSWYGSISLDENYRKLNHALKFPQRMRKTRQNGFAFVLEKTLPLYKRVSKGRDQLMVVGKYGLMSRFLRLDPLVPAWLTKTPLSLLFRAGSAVYDGIMRGSKRGFEIEPVVRFGEDFDSWVERVMPGYHDRILVNYSSKFLNWRYSDSSNRSYYRYLLKNHGKIRGFFILECYEADGSSVCAFAELFAGRNDEAAFRQILAGGIKEARQKGAAIVKVLESYLPELRRLYRRFGFFPGKASKHPVIIYPPADSDHSIIADSARYFICCGFADPKVL